MKQRWTPTTKAKLPPRNVVPGNFHCRFNLNAADVTRSREVVTRRIVSFQFLNFDLRVLLFTSLDVKLWCHSIQFKACVGRSMIRLIVVREGHWREKLGKARRTVHSSVAPSSVVKKPSPTPKTNHGLMFLAAGALAVASLETNTQNKTISVQSNWVRHSLRNNTQCDAQLHDFDDDLPSGYSERDRFFNTLEYHRSLLFDYARRWNDKTQSLNSKIHNSVTWPRNIPSAHEIPALELDLRFCLMSPNYRNNIATCQNLQFRIASFYVAQENDPNIQRRGFQLLKEVADHGHPDGMCLYAILLNEGRILDEQAKPEEAVIWWRRCVDLHRHITATYELAVAYYTGEGLTENPDYAVKLFKQAAHLGHAGAAYMLGECLLDGIGAQRDRASALEWLVTAAELGHGLARDRVLVLLNEDYEKIENPSEDGPCEETSEAEKWAAEQAGDGSMSNIERRFTLGAASGEVGRRKSKVLDSRRAE